MRVLAPAEWSRTSSQAACICATYSVIARPPERLGQRSVARAFSPRARPGCTNTSASSGPHALEQERLDLGQRVRVRPGRRRGSRSRRSRVPAARSTSSGSGRSSATGPQAANASPSSRTPVRWASISSWRLRAGERLESRSGWTGRSGHGRGHRCGAGLPAVPALSASISMAHGLLAGAVQDRDPVAAADERQAFAAQPARRAAVASRCVGGHRREPARAEYSTKSIDLLIEVEWGPVRGQRCMLLGMRRGSTNGSSSAGWPPSITRARSSSALNSAPSRIATFESHSQTRKMITPARVP